MDPVLLSCLLCVLFVGWAVWRRAQADAAIQLSLPPWCHHELRQLSGHAFATLHERMALVIRLARTNFERGTGGPFAAAVFERATGRLVAVGVNRVVACHCSTAHAEVMALSYAQRALSSYDLGAAGLPAMQLVVNWRPCAMCFGAVLWSGVQSLVLAGSGPEVEQITGFDEGPIHPEWQTELATRNIELVNGVLNADAIRVFEDFAKAGCLVYNARRGIARG